MADVFRLPRKLQRPTPPFLTRGFDPAPELQEWTRSVFIDEGGPLTNPEHRHLQRATIGMCWTGEVNTRNLRRVLGQAELMPPMAMGKWQRARAIAQLEDWFGDLPHFLITLDVALRDLDDATFCAIVEHELYHCAQQQGIDGPKFTRDGEPMFCIRGHDVEEFVGVVQRYGAGATAVDAMVEAAKRGPTVARASIAAACGTCQQRRRA